MDSHEWCFLKIWKIRVKSISTSMLVKNETNLLVWESHKWHCIFIFWDKMKEANILWIDENVGKSLWSDATYTDFYKIFCGEFWDSILFWQKNAEILSIFTNILIKSCSRFLTLIKYFGLFSNYRNIYSGNVGIINHSKVTARNECVYL